jgi:hypothetical protein
MNIYVGFEVLTVVVMKSCIFWYIMPCSMVRGNHCFGRAYRLHFQSHRVSQTRNQQKAGNKQPIDIHWTTQRYIPQDRTFLCSTIFALPGIAQPVRLLSMGKLTGVYFMVEAGVFSLPYEVWGLPSLILSE